MKCNKDHEHTPVAGNYKRQDGSWGPVSEYTELYTRVFGQRVSRTIMASVQIHEQSVVDSECILFDEDDIEQPESKRRRLGFKVSNPPGYPESAKHSDEDVNPKSIDPSEKPLPSNRPQEIKEILHDALKIAPRVGTMRLEDGNLFDSLQGLFPERQIRVVELCKGADRFRKPPIRMSPMEAPWRLTLGLHRHDLTPIPVGPWENWERLSNRQMCKKSPPTRIMLTLFGKDVSDLKRNLDREESPDMNAKRAKYMPADAHGETYIRPKEPSKDMGADRIETQESSPAAELDKLHQSMGRPAVCRCD